MGDNKENLGKQEQSGDFAHVRFHVLESQTKQSCSANAVSRRAAPLEHSLANETFILQYVIFYYRPICVFGWACAGRAGALVLPH